MVRRQSDEVQEAGDSHPESFNQLHGQTVGMFMLRLAD